MKKYNIGEIVTACVTGIEKYGIFVKLSETCNGLIHISEITDNYVKNIHDYVKVGEKIIVKIINVDRKKNRIELSIKGFDYRIDNEKSKTLETTHSGFSTLSIMLNSWIEQKILEMKVNAM